MKANSMATTHLKLWAMAGLTATVFTAANPALAADSKAYSGSECKPVSFVNNDKVGVQSRGSIINFSTSSDVRVVCPAVRDTSASIRGVVYLADRNPSRDISCTLKSVSPTGVIIGQSTRSTNSSFTNVLPLTFDSTVRGQGDASIFFECVIPRSTGGSGFSEIVSYGIREL